MSEVPKDSEGASGLSKWELALYIGIPVTALCVAGLAYMYLRKKEESKEDADVESPIVDVDSEPVSAPAEKVSKCISRH